MIDRARRVICVIAVIFNNPGDKNATPCKIGGSLATNKQAPQETQIKMSSKQGVKAWKRRVKNKAQRAEGRAYDMMLPIKYKYTYR